MEKKDFTIKMKDSYTVAELANIWYQITTTYKLAKEVHEKAGGSVFESNYEISKSNMAALRDYVTTKISTDDMVKLFDYLAGINRKSGQDIIKLWED